MYSPVRTRIGVAHSHGRRALRGKDLRGRIGNACKAGECKSAEKNMPHRGPVWPPVLSVCSKHPGFSRSGPFWKPAGRPARRRASLAHVALDWGKRSRRHDAPMIPVSLHGRC